MGFIDRLTKFFNKQIKQVGFIEKVGVSPSFTNNDFVDYIEDGYSANANLYAIVKLISSNFARAKWGAYRNEEVIPDHELTKLLSRPNPVQGQSEFFELLIGYKLLTGNTYIHLLSPDAGLNKGKPKMMRLLPSQHVDIWGNQWGEVAKYVLDINGADYEIEADRVIHLKNPNYEWDVDNRQLYGLSPVQAAAKVMQVNNDGIVSLASAFQNQGAVGFFSGMSDIEDMSEEKKQQLEERYRSKYMGPDKNGIPLFLNSEAKWTKLSVDPVDLAIIESQQWTLKQLCNIYQLPHILLDNDASTFNNMSEAREALWEENLLPALDQVKDELNRYFKQLYPDVEIDYDVSDVGVLQANHKDMTTWLAQADWMTINEKREQMGLDTVPDGDVILQPLSNVPLGESMPNIEKSYKASYSDYPQSASNNAKRALKYKEENGSDCGTRVGWERANQLANKEALSVETIKRTFSFLSRAETYYTEGGSLEECGNIMYLAWGGKSMKNWCESKLESLEE